MITKLEQQRKKLIFLSSNRCNSQYVHLVPQKIGIILFIYVFHPYIISFVHLIIMATENGELKTKQPALAKTTKLWFSDNDNNNNVLDRNWCSNAKQHDVHHFYLSFFNSHEVPPKTKSKTKNEKLKKKKKKWL